VPTLCKSHVQPPFEASSTADRGSVDLLATIRRVFCGDRNGEFRAALRNLPRTGARNCAAMIAELGDNPVSRADAGPPRRNFVIVLPRAPRTIPLNERWSAVYRRSDQLADEEGARFHSRGWNGTFTHDAALTACRPATNVAGDAGMRGRRTRGQGGRG